METVVVEKGMVVIVYPHKKYRHHTPYTSKVIRIFRNQFYVEGCDGKFWVDDLSHYGNEDYKLSLPIEGWALCNTYKTTYKREQSLMFKGVPWAVVKHVVRRIEGVPTWFFGTRFFKLKDNYKINDYQPKPNHCRITLRPVFF